MRRYDVGDDIPLTRGSWRADGLIWRWVPDPTPEPIYDGRRCRCGAPLARHRRLCDDCRDEGRRISNKRHRDRKRQAA